MGKAKSLKDKLYGAAVLKMSFRLRGDEESPAFVRQFASWGAGPRASQYLTLGAKARAAMDGRGVPNYEDVRAVAPMVLRHRVVTNFQAEAEGRTAADLVDELLDLSRKWT